MIDVSISCSFDDAETSEEAVVMMIAWLSEEASRNEGFYWTHDGYEERMIFGLDALEAQGDY